MWILHHLEVPEVNSSPLHIGDGSYKPKCESENRSLLFPRDGAKVLSKIQGIG